jgi:MFS family permease
MRRIRPTGFIAFSIVWIGQVFSLIGTNMTRFGLTIWAWQITGKATALSLVAFFSFAPALLVSPFAGAMVDRWSRKLTMMLSDLAAIVSTFVVLILFSTGNLQIFHLYITGAFSGFFQAFHFPAYSAAITMIVPKKYYGRANGMLSMAQFGSNILSPILASFFLGVISITGILFLDIVTFLLAIGALLLVHIPQPPISEEGLNSKGSLWKESFYGFRYIFERLSLFALLLVFFSLNLVVSFAITLFSPMILARTGNDTMVLSVVQSSMGVGGLIGGIVLSIWGGPKRKIHGVLVGMTFSMFGMLLFGLGREMNFWVSTVFFVMVFIPIINGSSQAIWQSKVAPDVQGRVFATRSFIAQISSPISMLLSGPLADSVFEPGMMLGGSLTPIFGDLIGTGDGAGMSLMFFIAGALGMVISLGGYMFHIVRNVEDILPDMVRAGKMIPGVDLWLNTPLPPLEASGTSGMKAAHNGVINFSVLDGWWIEGWIEDVTGWAIGPHPSELLSDEERKIRELDDLYNKLEYVILPMFYQRRDDWIKMMKNSIGNLAYYFNSHRMMLRYVMEAYL